MRTSRTSRAESLALGAARRARVPHAVIGAYTPGNDRPDPVARVRADEVLRIKALLPERRGRMLKNKLRFLRATAGIMAADLAALPDSGVAVLSCGDCHLNNFGIIGSADGSRPVFDINDFDETDPAPFEWDVKRLATSFVLAVRKDNPADDGRPLALTAAGAYATAMAEYAAAAPDAIWRARIDLDAELRTVTRPEVRALLEELHRKGQDAAEQGFPDLLTADRPKRRFLAVEDKLRPLARATDPEARQLAKAVFKAYVAQTRKHAPERAVLLDRYKLRDVAFKTAGGGSLGLHCYLGLFLTRDGDALVLQAKQAVASALAVRGEDREEAGNGARVARHQRILQTVPDPFLGWTRKPIRRLDFYVRQLKDARLSNLDESLADADRMLHARLCGKALARAHARAGDAARIAGYIGDGDGFATAIAEFALAYAAQVAQDFEVCRTALT